MQSGSFRKYFLLLSTFALLLLVGACKKQVAPPPPPPPPKPAPALPTVTLSASSSSIKTGESTTLTWSSTNATDLDLEPTIGKVAPEGSTSVSPTQDTTYTITATGPGGSANASVTISVTAPPPPPPPAPNLEELFSAHVFDAFFDFNKSDIRPDGRDALTKTAEFLRSYPQIRVTIEGHCDERGSTEYNLGLGQRRADAAKQFLASLGIDASRLQTMSWGKEHPFCTEHNEECWQQNRRAHFVMIH